MNKKQTVILKIERRNIMKKYLSLVLALVLCAAHLAGCGPKTSTVKVGASPAPHAEILEVVKEILAADGITLEIVEFNDYVLPNTALQEGELDANYFQHITYLNDFNAEHGTTLVSIADLHYEPLGLYPGQVASLDAIADGASIAVPNDGTNEARALMLLESLGLIKLKEGVGLSATKQDIAENPHNYDIVELDAQLLPTTRPDVAFAVINGNFALSAGLDSASALAFEDAAAAAAPYVNVLAVKAGNENNEALVKLAAALRSDEVKAFITEKYGSAVQPAF
jgi:D-methionine transport system substrate-binding protein